jgi:hypothetical protein
MKKVIIISILGFGLSGCFYQRVNSFDMNKAKHVCGSYENIEYINAYFDGNESVTCKNGVSKNITNYIIKDEAK